MIARLQTFWTLGLVLGTLLWLAYALPRSPALAVAGLACGWLLYFLFMGAQCALMHWRNQHDPAPRASLAAVLRAWWIELWVAVRVFCWDQPFRSHAEPDWLPDPPTGRRGVVLVHGFMCNRALWRSWFAPLRARGHAYVAVNLEPPFGSIDAYAATIDAAVRRVHAATGMAPLLVCHSMGGLAARAWLRSSDGDAAVAGVATLGTPHHGTWLGKLASAVNGRQMAHGSAWVRALAAAESTERRALFTCWYSNTDNIVFPASTATLVGADNRAVHGAAHVEMVLRPEVMQACLALLGSKN